MISSVLSNKAVLILANPYFDSSSLLLIIPFLLLFSWIHCSAWSWILVLKYFWPPSKWGKVHEPQKLVTTILWTRILHRTYSIITSPGHWVLAGLHVMSLNVMTSNNDCNLIPAIGMLGASKILFLLYCSINCNLRVEDRTPTLSSMTSDATHWATELLTMLPKCLILVS